MTDPSNIYSNELDCFKAELSEKDFSAFSSFIFNEFGIKMPPVKRVMLQGRLLKRIRQLNMKSYSEYKDYLFSAEGQKEEIFNFLNVVTTNKTDFFREPVHFDFLKNDVLPMFTERGTRETFKIWSAGCSSGEELYTIAMTLNEHKRENAGFTYKMLGTDISQNVLSKAAKGIYASNKVDIVPLELKKRYLLKSKDKENPTVKVRPELQSNLNLKYLNLMDSNYANINELFDVIFCRNVLIYFDRDTQESVINKLITHLKPGGIFFIGHSESLTGMDVPLEHIKPTIFRKKQSTKLQP
ncbi:CheR family methyltransferase [Saccharicrinis fermentans]|uniref:protein-glutamate O-methyltransferase n=1 Tax=Saccharicrinis fermentans DSM 9555 = JCM 21142 TaxID=869213 RepID=W7Y1I8_9BACT|nr:CheR family methyltransferase [Saccharicrinis fermentans]GAF01832.1 chemotaxis protein methyltransferase [Saccharicrinis fermentans DSM 9555 = JCM 21142]